MISHKTILAIDTATEACSAALSYRGKVYSLFEVCPQQHSQKILVFVDKLLSDAQLNISDLDAIAFGNGPGSFTGVRIATSTVQGLAYAHDLPVIPISTMAAMAYENYHRNRISDSLVMIDARMNEVYHGAYHCAQNGLVKTITAEAVSAPESLLTARKHYSENQLVGTGIQAYQALFLSKDLPIPPNILYPNAQYMLPIANFEFNQSNYKDVNAISPSYVRDTVTWKKLPGR